MSGTRRVDFAGCVRRIVPPVAVGLRCAEKFSGKERAGWKFKNVGVSHCWISRILSRSNHGRVHRVAEHFKDFSISGNDCHRVPLVGIHPDIPIPIEGDAVAAFENRMSDKDVAEAERVGCECGVTAGRTFELSMPVEFYLP